MIPTGAGQRYESRGSSVISDTIAAGRRHARVIGQWNASAARTGDRLTDASIKIGRIGGGENNRGFFRFGPAGGRGRWTRGAANSPEPAGVCLPPRDPRAL